MGTGGRRKPPPLTARARSIFKARTHHRKGAAKLRADGFQGDVKMLTSCPSCLQGLSRYNDDADMKSDYVVVEMAKHLLGANWMEKYVQKANAGGIERVLL